jgi:hypothetical protein
MTSSLRKSVLHWHFELILWCSILRGARHGQFLSEKTSIGKVLRSWTFSNKVGSAPSDPILEGTLGAVGGGLGGRGNLPAGGPNCNVRFNCEYLDELKIKFENIVPLESVPRAGWKNQGRESNVILLLAVQHWFFR